MNLLEKQLSDKLFESAEMYLTNGSPCYKMYQTELLETKDALYNTLNSKPATQVANELFAAVEDEHYHQIMWALLSAMEANKYTQLFTLNHNYQQMQSRIMRAETVLNALLSGEKKELLDDYTEQHKKISAFVIGKSVKYIENALLLFFDFYC